MIDRDDIIRMAQEVSQNFANRNYEDDLVEFFNMAYAAAIDALRAALEQEKKWDLIREMHRAVPEDKR